MELPKAYDPKKVEDKIYRLWEKSGFFNPDKLPGKRKKPYCIIMPPPNANGALHIGHAVFVTLQDILIRFERMRGKRTLWLPGADHAGFETQVVFDKKLEKQGRNRFQISREQLYEEMLSFTLENKKVMESQLRKLGASCDWSREKFTLDKDIVEIVNDTFKKLADDGLVYRENKIVNWCTKHQTTLSDLEVKYVERKDPLYYIKYGPVTLATIRLETKFGDTAVAVHPKDKRYTSLVGQEIEIKTLLGPAKIKVIADEAVDPEFGTGAVKVTPAHDPNDFEIWKRHKDEIPESLVVIDQYGCMDLNEFLGHENANKYHGLKVMEARKLMAENMQKEELIVKIDPDYTHAVATCYKCGTILEPRIMLQWFIKMTGNPSLRDLAARAVKRGKIKFVPQRMEKIFMHWMKNLRDWNISRQIVWGIRIPAWYHDICQNQGEPIVSVSPPKTCPYEGASLTHSGPKQNCSQDEDVFDTWFSSGQWSYAALKANSEKDLARYYPTDVMETGHDILFFWVARMIMLGLYITGKVPFKTVYLHGLVRDKDRQKMSKSKGNVIDPLGIAELYGTDAVRMALVVGNTAGNDIIISEEKIRGYRNFSNKIWNATRFLLQEIAKTKGRRQKAKTMSKDKTNLQKLKKLVKETTRDLENLRFHHAAERLYHFFWHYYADKVIEDYKKGLVSKDTLLKFHKTLIKLLHPFMPFITEEICQKLPLKKKKKCLMVQEWPK